MGWVRLLGLVTSLCALTVGGDEVQAVTLNAHGEHTCALLSDSSTKCWGRNEHGQLGNEQITNRGSAPFEMGEALPRLDLGTGRTIVKMAGGVKHRCAILDKGDVKCWGTNSYGQLGYGDTTPRGIAAGQMGDNLPTVDMGTGLWAVDIALGGDHTCVVLVNGAVKCWGRGQEGQLGSEREVSVGNAPGQMGDALPFVNLGLGRTAQKISTGYIHTCVILDGGDLKCFGDNFLGELGQEDQTRRGSKPGQMGDALPTVKLGSGQKAVQVSCGQYHSCARLEGNKLKCWGGSNNGQVGMERRGWIGSAFGQMGDDLPYVNLGTDRYPVDVQCAHSATCARLDNNQVKCWGMNSGGLGDGGGILGTGDTIQRGDDVGEMGDALPAVDFGSGRGAIGLTMGNSHGCAVLTDGLTKCWGLNRYGQLGLENMQAYGGTPETIGENLPPVNFGSPLSTTTVTVSTTTSRTTTATNTSTVTSSTSTVTTTSSTSSTTLTTETTTYTTVSSTTGTNTSTTTTETSTFTSSQPPSTVAATTNTTTSTSTTTTNTTTTTTTTSVAQPAANASASDNETSETNLTNFTTMTTTTIVANTSTLSTTTATNTTTTSTSTVTNTTTVTLTMTTSFTTATNTNTSTSTTTTTPPDLLGTNDALADLSLNFTMSALPPGPVIVQDADSGGWAAQSGIMPGDQLLSIDGKDVAAMSPKELYEALQNGPGAFQFQRDFIINATISLPGYSQLGFTTDGLPPDVVTIASVVPGGWAELAGFVQGDQLTSISGPATMGQSSRRLQGMAGMTLADFMRTLDTVRPLTFGVSRTTTASLGGPPPTEMPTNKSSWDLFTGRDLLGFTVDNLPPDPVRIQMTGPDSWVAACAVPPGSLLASINGQDVSQMAPDEFLQTLQQTRPIALSFIADPGGSAVAPGGQTLSADRMSYTASATVTDLVLGFSVGGLAPDTVRVAALDDGKWADRSGVVVGDQLVAVNNISVSQMTSDDLISLLQDSRPLNLSFLPRRLDMPAANLSLWAQPADKPLYFVTAAPPDVKLGMTVAGMPPAAMLVSSTEAGLWADVNSVAIGDELVAINGVDISTTAPDEVMRLLQDVRPLSLTFARALQAPSADSTNCTSFTALAVVQDYGLGLFVSPRSDASAALGVVGVEGGKWAARSGVVLGDLLQFLNGQNVSMMEDEEVMSTLLAVRPLAATFFRCSPVQPDQSNTPSMPVDKVRQPYMVAAGVDAVQLGMAISGTPPNPVQIAALRAGGWADKSSVAVGDTLQSVNGIPVADMSPEQLVSLLQESRPLTLMFAPPDTSSGDGNATKPLLAIPIDQAVYQVTANSSDLLLGFSVDGVPPGPVTVSAVDPGGWAVNSGVGPGDELLSLNGQNVSSLSPGDFVQLLRFERPLVFAFSLAGGSLGVAGREANFSSASCYVTTATPDDQALGLYIAPKVGQVFPVTAIQKGQWAHKKGVAAGDVLLSINGVSSSGLQAQEVLQQLSMTRPLSLSFCSPPPAEPPSMNMPVDLLRGPYSVNLTGADSKLGFSLGGMPPSCTRIAAVKTGQWADRSGILVGDELAFLNGTQVSNMSLDALIDMLRNGRPLVLGFVPRLFSDCPSDASLLAALPVDPLEYNVSATIEDAQLGFYISGTPPGTVLVTATEPGKWAERSGVKVADQLKSVNGRDLSLMDANELISHLRNIRPLNLWFTASEPGTNLLGNPDVLSCDSYTVSAKPTDAELGLFVSGIFTLGAPVVGVETGLWAERSGIQFGDILSGLNGRNVTSMQQPELLDQLQSTRPLFLVMNRCFPRFPPMPVDKQIRLGYYANATVDDTALGLSLHGLPPYRVRAGAVPVRAWADRAGVMAGDELLTINGQPVSNMTAQGVIQTLQETRPLSLYFLPRPQNSSSSLWGGGWDPDLRATPVDKANQLVYTVNSTLSREKLGLYVFGMPPEPVSVGSVAPSKWADLVGIATGDKLQSVDGQDVSQLSVDDFLGILKDTRPLAITLSRDPSKWDSPGPGASGAQDCPAFPALASETDTDLGLFISSMENKVGLIVGVESDQWAESSAMAAGDVVTQVNDQDVAGMTAQQFADALQARPLSVVFGHCAPVSVGAPSEYYTANATVNDSSLGFLPIQAFDTTDIYVASVAPSSWADLAQISPGDQLLLVNGVDVSTLPTDELMRQLQLSRPLSLYFLRGEGLGPSGSIATGTSKNCTNYSAFATHPADLGMTVLVTSDATMYIVSVTPGLWAERAGLTAGDTLRTLNGRSAAQMSKLEWDFHMTVIRPLIVVFTRCAAQGGLPPGVITPGGGEAGGGSGVPGDSGDGQQAGGSVAVPVSCVATGDDDSLGFGLASSPGQALVATVETGSWGEDCGLLVGDRLVAVNGSDVSLLLSEDLKAILDTGRPLTLDFVRTVQPSSMTTTPLNAGNGSESGGAGSASGSSGEAGGGATPGQTSQAPATTTPAGAYTVVATPADLSLGFSPLDMPPKPVRIVVGGEQWAARSGITSGDVLLTINGANASAMTREGLLQTLLNTRPLSLVFVKGEPLRTNGTQSPPKYPGTPGDGFAWPWLESTTLLPSTYQDPGDEVYISSTTASNVLLPYLTGLLLLLAAL